MLPRALVPHRCVVCHLTFNRRQSLSRHYKKQHRLPREWREFGNPEPAALAVLQNVSAVLPVSTPQETSTEPSTSMAAWADEAVTAALAVLPAPEGVDVGPDEDDLPSTLDLESDEESDGAEAAVRGVSTAVPPRCSRGLRCQRLGGADGSGDAGALFHDQGAARALSSQPGVGHWPAAARAVAGTESATSAAVGNGIQLPAGSAGSPQPAARWTVFRGGHPGSMPKYRGLGCCRHDASSRPCE